MTSLRSPLLIAAGVAASLSSAAAFDVERICIFGVGPSVQEVWPGIPPAGIPMRLMGGPGSSIPAPGMPDRTLSASCFASSAAMPVEQSFVAAANAWNLATVPGTAVPISTFRINTTLDTSTNVAPSVATWLATTPSFMSATDGFNTLSFWEFPAYFSGIGAAGSLAVASVSVSTVTGQITDADIAFNCLAQNTAGVPLYVFIENNARWGRTLGTTALANFTAGTFQAPTDAYADIQGILTHELGHLAGLGHTLVDADANPASNNDPTMYAFAQAELWGGTIAWGWTAGCFGSTNFPANGTTTVVGGLLGRSARTLEADDRSSIARGYPSPLAALFTGAIAGRIVDGASNPVVGAHVVAVRANDPDGNRVGTLSFENGLYSIVGLTPGDYYVYVEPPDVAGYFAMSGLPNFILPPFFWGCATPPTFVAEYWDDTGEALVEFSPQTAVAVTVAANATRGGVDTVVAPGRNLLEVRYCLDNPGPGCTGWSNRGAIATGLTVGMNHRIEFRIQGGAAWANTAGVLAIGVPRSLLPFTGQLIEPANFVTVPLATDAFGNWSTTIPISAQLAFATVFAQAAMVPAAGLRMTNAPTIWLATR